MKRFIGLMIVVALTLTGCGGDSSGGTNNNPTASFTASPQSGEAPLTVAFDASGSSDSDGSIASYAWDFGDGNTGTGQTPSHTFSAAGNYTVTLTVTDNDSASNSAAKTIDVSASSGGNTAPSASFTASPSSGEAPLTVAFDASGSSDPDGSIASYAWDFGDGDAGSGQTPSHTFNAGGNYTVTLTVTDNDGATNSATNTIDVSTPPGGNTAPSAAFTASPSSGEAPLSVSFDASGSSDSDGTIASYSWAFGDGGTGTGQTLSHTFSAAGNYTVTLTVTDNDGARNSATRTIDVSTSSGGNTAPTAAFTATPDSGQAPLNVDFDASGSSDPDGSIATYAWDFGDGDSGTGQTLSHTYNAAGSYTAELTVTDNDGASSSVTQTIDVSDVTVQAVPAYVSFPGTSTATIDVTSNGDWTAETDQSWLQLSQSSGSGDTTITVTIDRSSITPDHYAGSVLLKGGTSRDVVTVYMRFPEVSGNITSSTGQIQTGSLSLQSKDEPQLAAGTYVPGEVLVVLEPYAVAIAQGLQGQSLATVGADISVEALEATAMDLASTYGFSVSAPMSTALPVFTFNTRGTPVAEALQILRADGRIKHVEPNGIVKAHATPNDSRYPDQWHYGVIDLPQAWDLTVGSTDVIVAVVDSGVDTTHSDLSANLLPGYDFVDNTTSMSDPDGHGTHVSGTVAAVTDNAIGVAGVGWQTKVRPVRVLDSTGSGTRDNIYRGIVFAAGLCVNNSAGTQVCPNYQADVINLSLGLDNPTCASLPQDHIWEDAVAFATGNGSTVIASAGNDGCNIVGTPAAYAGAIAVSATDPNNNRAPYSNYGPEIWIAAPGGDINNFGTTGGVLSTIPGDNYGYSQGTSMAAPHISGVAALLLAANPDLTPVDIQFLLSQTARDLGTAGWDQLYGWGLVDADAAVQAARDLLTAYYSDFVVRLTDGSSTVAEVRADSGGNFVLTNVASGTYTLEAGNDYNNNGVLGDPGEFYGSTSITINYDGDSTGIGLGVEAR